MPSFDFQCPKCSSRYESLLKRYDDPNPSCPCGAQLDRLPAAPATIWAKPAGAYGSASKEYHNEDGFWVTRVNSSRNADGSPEREFITSVSQQRQFCREEGLMMPDNINPNAEMSKDGRTLKTTGIAGQWTSVPSDLVSDNGRAHIDGWI